jgi:hypothetical protein
MVESEIKSPLLHGRCNLIAVARDLKRSFWLSVFFRPHPAGLYEAS